MTAKKKYFTICHHDISFIKFCYGKLRRRVRFCKRGVMWDEFYCWQHRKRHPQ